MEEYETFRDKSLHFLKAAHQGIAFTYPLLKENKVLLSIVHDLFKANSSAMAALLHFESYNKRIPIFSNSFEEMMHIYRSNVMEKYHLDPIYFFMLRDLKDLVIAHRDAPVEFSRGDAFVICNDNYDLKEITIENCKKAEAKTKLFIEEIISLIS